MEVAATNIVMKMLDGLDARAIATAQNIANAGSPGYRPVRVTFEQALRDAAGSPAAIQGLRPEYGQETASGTQEDVRLDLEMATASATATRYAALADLLNRQLQIEALAVSGGR